MDTQIDSIYVSLLEPNTCPHCHVKSFPQYRWATINRYTDDYSLILSVWDCANFDCNKTFVAQHSLPTANSGGYKQTKFQRFLNGLPKGPEWPKPIKDLLSGDSKDPTQPEPSRFITTYLQSLEAESHGLDEIAGMGYRKAIEYLVKDWAIQNKPEDKDKIEKSWLGGVIKTYYQGDLKDILERATWLGNDQSHYNKLFEEYNISDLKELIDLIMVELDRQYKMKMYIETIQNRK